MPCFVINLNSMHSLTDDFSPLVGVFYDVKPMKQPSPYGAAQGCLDYAHIVLLGRIHIQTPWSQTHSSPVTALSLILWVRAGSQLIPYSANHLVYHRPKPGACLLTSPLLRTPIITWTDEVSHALTSVNSNSSFRSLGHLDIHLPLY